MLTQAPRAKIDLFICQYNELKNHDGRKRIVRNSYLPERTIQSGSACAGAACP